MADSLYDPVQVFLRIRPESQHVTSSSTAARGNRLSASPATSPRRDSFNSENGQRCAVQLDDKTIKITPPDLGSRKSVAAVDDKLFTFDKVFPEDCSQEDLYESVSGLVKATVGGYNTTIFAYGSTGSGKSYTMTGSGNAPGIIPRAISEIFSMIEATAMQERDVFFYVRMSYVELYNNNFRNLLEFSSKQLELKKSEEAAESGGFETDGIGFGSAPNSNISNSSHSRGRSSSPTSRHRSDKIEVRECQSTGVFLAGPSLRIPVTTAQEAFQLIAKGNKCRAVGSTQCNDVSSR
jgi:centromeric protein E